MMGMEREDRRRSLSVAESRRCSGAVGRMLIIASRSSVASCAWAGVGSALKAVKGAAGDRGVGTIGVGAV